MQQAYSQRQTWSLEKEHRKWLISPQWIAIVESDDEILSRAASLRAGLYVLYVIIFECNIHDLQFSPCTDFRYMRLGTPDSVWPLNVGKSRYQHFPGLIHLVFCSTNAAFSIPKNETKSAILKFRSTPFLSIVSLWPVFCSISLLNGTYWFCLGKWAIKLHKFSLRSIPWLDTDKGTRGLIALIAAVSSCNLMIRSLHCISCFLYLLTISKHFFWVARRTRYISSW